MSLILANLIDRVIDENIDSLEWKEKKRLMTIWKNSVYYNIIHFRYWYFIVEMKGFDND